MGIRYKINEKFFETWSPCMAYVLGYIYADGCLIYTPKMRGKYISVTSTDLITLTRFKEWMKSEHKIIKIKKKSGYKTNKPAYALRIGNARLYDSLRQRGLYQNKSLTVTFPEIPQDMLGHFIRGYFDGDGCVYLEKTVRKSGKIRPKKLNVIFTSGSEKFLKELSEYISKEIGTKERKVLKSWTAYQTRYSTNDSELLFQLMYAKVDKDEYLERKHDIFIEHFKLKA